MWPRSASRTQTLSAIAANESWLGILAFTIASCSTARLLFIWGVSVSFVIVVGFVFPAAEKDVRVVWDCSSHWSDDGDLFVEG